MTKSYEAVTGWSGERVRGRPWGNGCEGLVQQGFARHLQGADGNGLGGKISSTNLIHLPAPKPVGLAWAARHEAQPQ